MHCFGDFQRGAHVLGHQSGGKAGVIGAGEHVLLALVFGGVVHAARGVDDVDDHVRINAEGLAGVHRFAGGDQSGGRYIVVECLDGVTGAQRAGEINLAAHFFEHRFDAFENGVVAADHD